VPFVGSEIIFREKETENCVDNLILRDLFGGSDERLYALGDAMSVTAVTDTTGAVQERYGYDAFGNTNVMNASFGNLSGSAYDWETRFCGYRWDDETNFYQVRNRYLHPSLGRWLSRDPIKEQGGLNLYAYVRNRPVNQSDPTGLGAPGVQGNPGSGDPGDGGNGAGGTDNPWILVANFLNGNANGDSGSLTNILLNGNADPGNPGSGTPSGDTPAGNGNLTNSDQEDTIADAQAVLDAWDTASNVNTAVDAIEAVLSEDPVVALAEVAVDAAEDYGITSGLDAVLDNLTEQEPYQDEYPNPSLSNSPTQFPTVPGTTPLQFTSPTNQFPNVDQ